jgi:hypothetical protein
MQSKVCAISMRHELHFDVTGLERRDAKRCNPAGRRCDDAGFQADA